MTHVSSNIVRGNAVIGQAGGPTAVVNQSMVGIAETLRQANGIDKILGCLHGVRGIIQNQFVELQDIPQPRLDDIARTPSAGLASSRDKPDEAYCQRIFESLEKRNIHYFFYIGGNDSADTCHIINELSNSHGYELRCFHVPKTIDNDLACNDHTPGYGSAARFVAHAVMGDNLDNRALLGVKIEVIMGRHAGFLTAASMLARQTTDDGPHLIYVPEVDFDLDRCCDDVERIHSRFGRCVMAISEGIHDADGTPMIAKLAEVTEVDAHGNVQLSGTGALGDFLAAAIRQHLGSKIKSLRVRADTFGYLQRSFPACISAVDAEEARMVGRKAAEAALSGNMDGSIAIERVSNDPYRVRYKIISLKDVAGKTRSLDRRYIADEGNDIHESYREYVGPLVGPLPTIASLRTHDA